MIAGSMHLGPWFFRREEAALDSCFGEPKVSKLLVSFIFRFK